MMPGVGHIGGRMSVIGGFAVRGGVDIIETFDEDGQEWLTMNGVTVRKPR